MPRLSILIVENTSTTAYLFYKTLEAQGHICQTATTAEEALHRITGFWENGHTYDIIILDTHLPKMDGAELCEILRGKVKPKNYNHIHIQIPTWIIACSRDTKPETVAAMLRAGANDFLPKPVSPDRLITRVLVAQQMMKLNLRHTKLGEKSGL